MTTTAAAILALLGGLAQLGAYRLVRQQLAGRYPTWPAWLVFVPVPLAAATLAGLLRTVVAASLLALGVLGVSALVGMAYGHALRERERARPRLEPPDPRSRHAVANNLRASIDEVIDAAERDATASALGLGRQHAGLLDFTTASIEWAAARAERDAQTHAPGLAPTSPRWWVCPCRPDRHVNEWQHPRVCPSCGADRFAAELARHRWAQASAPVPPVHWLRPGGQPACGAQTVPRISVANRGDVTCPACLARPPVDW